MSETLELPNGDVVDTEDVFLYNDYPYRFVPLDHPEFAFKLTPLYWGNSDMDVPFPDRSDLVEQWDERSRGVLTDEEWRSWVESAREDERFDDAEIDHVANELGLEPRREGTGVVGSIRDALGL
jgi:hypothetical protein